MDTGAAGYKAWVTANQERYVDPPLLPALSGESGEAAIVNNQIGAELAFRYLRNGGPREGDVKLSFSSVYVVNQNDEANLIFVGKYDVDYLGENKQLLAAYKDAGYAEDDVFARLPHLRDTAGTSQIRGTMQFQYAMASRGDSWKITGLTNTFNNEIED